MVEDYWIIPTNNLMDFYKSLFCLYLCPYNNYLEDDFRLLPTT